MEPRHDRANPTYTLNNGVQMPVLGFGVFQAEPEQTLAAVSAALQTGYRHVDTAASYRNERQVGEAVRQRPPERRIRLPSLGAESSRRRAGGAFPAQRRSNRSRFITWSHAATKSWTNFSCPSSLA
jgi:aryl-alcohol dehydrogenase-like predicted oxidoreductase